MSDPESNPSKAPSGPISGIGPRVREIPDGDNRPRLVCPECAFIKYDNPLVVVGAVVTWEDRILLCRRAIEPRSGFWTIPAGYLELNESPEEGAVRETKEEACADIEIDSLLAVYNITRISQVQLIYRATLRSPAVAPGEESEEVGLYEWDSIPWDDIAFPSVHWALNHHRNVRDQPVFAAHTNPPA
ncbi:MAG: NUDIX domain-containing protein [Alphaproteobacteria bacterium]|nr:NUDIX domain-containing protein [Alphaproteobacteria bacterium]